VARRAEVTPFAGESEQDLVMAAFALDPGETLFKSPQQRYL
jgi:hypothetical protein